MQSILDEAVATGKPFLTAVRVLSVECFEHGSFPQQYIRGINYTKKNTYSEIFYSMQGEGKYTGATAWLRLCVICNVMDLVKKIPQTHHLHFLSRY